MQRVKPMNLITGAKAFGRKHTFGRFILSPLFGRTRHFGLLGLLLLLVMTACSGPAETPAGASQDIVIEAQAVATATPAVPAVEPTNDTVAGQDPTSTELATEIIEPLSPLPSPASPEANESAAGAAASSAVEEVVETMDTIPGSEQAVAAAIADLIQRTGVTLAEITLVSLEAREWSDTSLGCPQEGYMYAQVITPGYFVVLEAQGVEYIYHTDGTSTVVLCQE